MAKTGRPKSPGILDRCPWGRGRFYVICFLLDTINAHWEKEDKKSKKTKGGRPSSRGLAELHELRDEVCRRFKLSKGELKALVEKEEKLRLEQKEQEDKNWRRMMADDRCWTPWEGF